MSQSPAAVSVFAELWNRHVAATAAFNAHVDTLAALELGAGYGRSPIFGDGDKLSMEPLRKTIIERLIQMAEVTFAPAGARLTIPLPQVSKHAAARMESFDPKALWDYLAGTYGDGKSHADAFRTIAKSLVSSFRLRAGEEVTTVKGGLSLKHRMWPENFGAAYSYNSREGALQMLKDLRAFLNWAALGLDELTDETDFGNARDLIWSVREITRQKLPLGANAGAILFKTSIEIRLSPQASAKFHEFLSTYASGFVGSAAQQAA